ncbi:hypothetical protein HK102_005829 [Quaeritorhiza haematococci]|nr:hypothetical protein HK102_005829 [Quaeritorhiza haematococci]
MNHRRPAPAHTSFVPTPTAAVTASITENFRVQQNQPYHQPPPPPSAPASSAPSPYRHSSQPQTPCAGVEHLSTAGTPSHIKPKHYSSQHRRLSKIYMTKSEEQHVQRQPQPGPTAVSPVRSTHQYVSPSRDIPRNLQQTVYPQNCGQNVVNRATWQQAPVDTSATMGVGLKHTGEQPAVAYLDGQPATSRNALERMDSSRSWGSSFGESQSSITPLPLSAQSSIALISDVPPSLELINLQQDEISEQSAPPAVTVEGDRSMLTPIAREGPIVRIQTIAELYAKNPDMVCKPISGALPFPRWTERSAAESADAHAENSNVISNTTAESPPSTTSRHHEPQPQQQDPVSVHRQLDAHRREAMRLAEQAENLQHGVQRMKGFGKGGQDVGMMGANALGNCGVRAEIEALQQRPSMASATRRMQGGGNVCGNR